MISQDEKSPRKKICKPLGNRKSHQDNNCPGVMAESCLFCSTSSKRRDMFWLMKKIKDAQLKMFKALTGSSPSYALSNYITHSPSHFRPDRLFKGTISRHI